MKKGKKIPSVRMAFPKGRPIQLRYTDRETGKEVRISTKTYDHAVAEEQKKDLEAKLRLGQDARPTKRSKGHLNMPWDEFREQYSQLYLPTIREGSAEDAESRLDVAERILKPVRLRDVVSSEALTRLQAELLAGKENPLKRPRSKHTVKSRMGAFVAVLNWAYTMGWIPSVPSYTPLVTAKLKKMKGRPLTLEEFERMLAVTPKVVGNAAAESWQYLLRGAVESGLRLDELMNLSWDDPNAIMPVWEEGEVPLLSIPADRQKNDVEESIPLVPGFEALLLETPPEKRIGWVFTPVTLQIKLGKKPHHRRPTSKWVGKVIGRIGKQAGIIVQPAKGQKPPKFASAHDLRRTFANQLRKAGVRLDDVAVVIRHSSTETTKRYYAPANVEQTGQTIRAAVKGQYLGTPPNPDCKNPREIKDIRDQGPRFFKPGADATPRAAEPSADNIPSPKIAETTESDATEIPPPPPLTMTPESKVALLEELVSQKCPEAWFENDDFDHPDADDPQQRILLLDERLRRHRRRERQKERAAEKKAKAAKKRAEAQRRRAA